MKAALTFMLNDLNLVITMPNADTLGTEFRRVKELLKREFPDKIVYLIENFGKTNLFYSYEVLLNFYWVILLAELLKQLLLGNLL